MTFDEFRVFIKPLAVHFGAVKDEPTWRLYHAALMHPPAPSAALLARALPRAASSRKFFPSVEELRADAEVERRAFLAANPYNRCESCRDNCGWVKALDGHGVERLRKCDCFERYRALLTDAGIGEPLALPPAEEQDRSLTV